MIFGLPANMRFKTSFLFVLVSIFWSLSFPFQANATPKTPKVVVTVKPIYELTKIIMEGAGSPQLLLEGTTDPHHFSLQPSLVKKLQDSDLIIWVGPTLEGFLIKPLISMKKRTLPLMSIDGMMLLRREHHHSCLLKEACVDQTAAEKKIEDLKALFEKEVTSLDPHIWLSVENVKLIVKEIAFHLSAMDLLNAKRYTANSKELIKKLDTFKGEIDKLATPLAHNHFVAFHDGYAYIEHAYKLKNSAVELITHGHSPSLKAVQELKQLIRKRKIECILVDPQHISSLEQKLAEDHDMAMVEADPLGLEVESGPDHYFNLMRTLILDFGQCFKKDLNGPSVAGNSTSTNAVAATFSVGMKHKEKHQKRKHSHSHKGGHHHTHDNHSH